MVIHADDKDVFILLLGHSNVLSNTHTKVGKGCKSKIIDIDKVKVAITSNFHAHLSSQEFCRSLSGMYVCTGYHSISALADKARRRVIKLLLTNSDYVAALSNLGNAWIVSAPLLSKLEFVCALYWSATSNVDILHYQYAAQTVEKLSQKLPPHANQDHFPTSRCPIFRLP